MAREVPSLTGLVTLAVALAVSGALRAAPIEARVAETSAPAVNEDAVALFEAGHAAWQAGQTDRAADLLRRAYDALPEPTFLFNLGVVLEEGGRLEEALATYRRYVGVATDAEGVEQAVERIEATRAAFGKGRLTVLADGADAAVSVDGKSIGWAPVERVLVGAGTHRVRVEAPGEPPLELLATVDAGETRVLTINLRPRAVHVPDAQVPTTPPDEGVTELEAWGLGIGVSGTALLISGVAVVLAGETNRNGGYDGAGERDRSLGVGLVTAGGVAAIAGAIIGLQ